MKTFKLLAGTLILASLAVCSCSDDESGETPGSGFATVTSDSSSFVADAAGGSVSFSANGGTIVLNVDCDTDWEAVNDSPDWLDANYSVSAGTVTLNALQNTEANERTAQVVLHASVSGVRLATVNVTQAAAAYLTVSAESVEIAAEGGTASVTVESNYTVSATAADSWCSVSVGDGTVTVSASENNDVDRETTVTLTAGDGAENVAMASFTVSQAAVVSWDPDAMVLEFVTTGADEEVVLPFSGTVDITVDWGDGSDAEAYSSSINDLISHTYASAGTYDVAVTGTATTINTQSYAAMHSSVYSSNLVAVRQWGSTGLTTVQLAYATSLKELPEETGDALASVTSVSNMFKNSALESIPADLFAKINAASLNSAFSGCESIKSVPEGLFAKCENIRDVGYLFYGCSSLESLPSDLFSTCNLCSGFSRVFQNCTSLKTIPEGLFAAAGSDCTDFSYLFSGCTGLTSVPTDIFDSVFANNYMNFSDTFQNCSALTCESPYKEVSVDGSTVKVHLYEREDYSSSDEVGTTRSYTDCFAGSTFTDIDSIPSSWGGNK